jgi:hypothetical protein
MNPRNYIKPIDFIKSFTLENLLEYKEVMTYKLSELSDSDEFEIKQVKNLLIIVENEINSRPK